MDAVPLPSEGVRRDAGPIAGPWTRFFVAVQFLLLFPLLPLGAELLFTGKITIASLTLVTAKGSCGAPDGVVRVSSCERGERCRNRQSSPGWLEARQSFSSSCSRVPSRTSPTCFVPIAEWRGRWRSGRSIGRCCARWPRVRGTTTARCGCPSASRWTCGARCAKGLVFLQPADRRRIAQRLRGGPARGYEGYLHPLLCTSMDQVEDLQHHA